MQPATVDEKLVKFDSAAAAYSWAVELLSKHPVESQIARIQKVIGSGEYTMDELRDQALTIVSLVSRTDPVPGRLLFEFVYGVAENGEISQHLIDAVMRQIYENVPIAKKKHAFRVVTLVCNVIIGYRLYIQENRLQRNSELATAVGVLKQNFRVGGWQDMVDITRRSLQEWMEIVERNITDGLSYKGFIR